MNPRLSLVLCMWETRVQIPVKFTHVILSFSPEGKFEMRVPKLKNTVTNTKEAVFKLFGFIDPPKLSGEIPKPSFIQTLKNLNPFDLFNPDYIPYSKIVPKNLDEVIRVRKLLPTN